MNKSAFVSGSTGFLGLNLIETLQEKGWDVYALHRKTSNLHYLSRFNVHRVVGDIGDYDSLLKAMPEHVDVVFHAAANTSYWSKNNKKQYQENVIGTRNIVNCTLEKKGRRFVHTSSISSFGKHEGIIDEQAPSNVLSVRPRINYDITKYYSEQEVLDGVSKGLNAVILNPCRIMGPYETRWSQFIKMVYNDQKPPFIPPGIGMLCHAKDVAHAHISAVEKGKSGERFLIGGKEASFLDIINEVQKIKGKPFYKHITPRWKLALLARLLSIPAFFTKQKPLLTPELVVLLSEKITCNYEKSMQVLGYQPSSPQKIVSDSIQWLKEEKGL